MARLPKDVLLEKVRKYIGDRTDDETLEIIEDISDSVDTSNADEWEQKYKENDKMWRDKYISRFFDKKEDEEDEGLDKPNEDEEEEKEYSTYDDLFEKEED